MLSDAHLQIITDALREAGLEDVARWVEHREAVRSLLRLHPYADSADECQACRTPTGDPHDRDCYVVAAWRLLGDERADLDTVRAWESALAVHARRADIEDGRATRRLQAGETVSVRLDAAGMRLFDVRPVPMGAIAHDDCTHLDSEAVTMGDGVTVVDRCRHCGTISSR